MVSWKTVGISVERSQSSILALVLTYHVIIKVNDSIVKSKEFLLYLRPELEFPLQLRVGFHAAGRVHSEIFRDASLSLK